jgi:integrase
MTRKRGGHNKGYWFRKGRGWYATTSAASPLPLRDENENHLRGKHQEEQAKRAYARYILAVGQEANQVANGENTPLLTLCNRYLDFCQANNRLSTYRTRADFLFDFATGFPAKFRDKGKGKTPPKPTSADRIHQGFGAKPVGELTPLDLDEWLQSHPNWKSGTQRMAVQTIKRCLNYAWQKGAGIIPSNPIRGFTMPQSQRRITYFTPELEALMYANCNKAVALAIKVCIRTGVRYGCEFCPLTSRHIEETPKGMLWKFSADESKTHVERKVFVPDEVAEIVRQLLKKSPIGEPIFRNKWGKPWTRRGLMSAFLRLKKRLETKGMKLPPNSCMYSTRHTYAKRVLSGYWNGKATSIEVLSGLMGNSRDVCWRYYAQWCDNYTDPLWDAVASS